MQEEWELSRIWTSDGQGMRSVAVDASSGLWAGTQAGSVTHFGGISDDSMKALEVPHPHAVTAVAYFDEMVITGCKDAQLRLFAASTGTLLATLPAHDKPITSLALSTIAGKHFLLTGSWDGTAKLWVFSAPSNSSTNAAVATSATAPNNFVPPSLVTTLPGHENSVCVTFLPCSTGTDNLDALRIATGSAGIAQNNRISGHAVRIWTVNANMGAVVGPPLCVSDDHQGPIRDILYAHNTLYTCSNDGTVKIREPDTGVATATLSFVTSQHPPMLLSLAALHDGTLAASAEDGHVVVWQTQSNAEPQVLRHASCVWQVVGYQGVDLITASDDGCLRLFTRDTARWATEDVRQDFANAAAAAASGTGPTAEEIAKLPAWETNASRPGTSEGQVQVFRKGEIAIAAQWNMASQCWIEVGQVMGNAGGGGSDGGGGTIDGVAYDHILPIEVDTTGGQVARLQLGYNTGDNPFTAAQRFIDAHMLPQYHLAQIADYISQRVGAGPTTLGGGPSPPTAATGVPTVSYEHLPSTAFCSFGLTAKTAGSLNKMQQKIREANILTDTELANLENVVTVLAATNRYHSSKLSDADLAILPTLLTKWQPAADCFPALDLARLVVLHPDAAGSARTVFWKSLLSQTLQIGQAMGEGAAAPVPMLTLRLVANAFVGGPGSLQAVQGVLSEALDLCATNRTHTNKNVRLSVATVIFNVCHALPQASQHPVDATLISSLLPLIDHILGSRTWEEMAVQRTLLALGTLVHKDGATAKAAAQAMFLTAKVELAASPHSAQVKEIAKEVYRILQ